MDATQSQDEQGKDQARYVSAGPVTPVLPGYTLERAIGRGAFGEVWAALQNRTGQRVAIKLLARSRESDWSRFRAELQRLGEVAEHPYVITLLDADLNHDPAFLVMPLMQRSLSGEARPPLAQALEWLEQMASALQYMHDKGILHCDFKPSNVLLDEQDRVRIADFGQSLRRDEEHGSYGTLGFMAPEQAALGSERAGSQPSVAWDVYGWGATAYALLTGTAPRLGAQELEELHRLPVRQRLAEYPLRLATHALQPISQVDGDLACIVGSCLQLDPARRPRSLHEVLEDLQRRRNRDPLLCRRPWSLGYRAGKLLARPLVALTLVFLLLGSAGLWLAFQRQRSQLAQLKSWRGEAAEEHGQLDEAALWWAAALADRPDVELLRVRLQDRLSWLQSVSEPLPDPYGLLFSPDGSKVVVPCTGKTFSLTLLDVASGQRLVRLETKDPVTGLAFSPDGRRLLLKSGCYSSQIWDVATGKPLTAVLADGPESESPVAINADQPDLEVDWSRDGQRVACRSGPELSRVFEAHSGRPCGPAVPESRQPIRLDASGTRLLTWTTLWDVATAKPVFTFGRAACVSGDRRWGAAPRSGQGIEVVELASGRVLRRLPGAAERLEFSQDGRWLLALDSEHGQLWDLSKQAPPIPIPLSGTCMAVCFSADGTHLACWEGTGRIRVWLTAKGVSVGDFSQSTDDQRQGRLRLSADGKVLVAYDEEIGRAWTSTGQALTPVFPSKACALLSPNGQHLAVLYDRLRVWNLNHGLAHPGADAVRAVFSPDGRYLATGSDSGEVRLWDERGRLLWQVRYASEIRDLQFRPDGQALLAVEGEPVCQLLGLDGKPLLDISLQASLQHAHRVQFSSDGRWLLCRDAAGQEQLRDAGTGRSFAGVLDRPLLSPDSRWLVTSTQFWDLSRAGSGPQPLGSGVQFGQLCFSADSRRLAGYDGERIWLWGLPEGTALRPPLPCPHVGRLRFSGSGENLLIGSQGKTLLLEVAAGQVGPLDEDGQPELSPDGRWLATCSDGRTVRLRSSDGRRQSPPLEHAQWVEKSVFSPDSQRLATLCRDHIVRLWDTASGKALGSPFAVGATGQTLSFSPDGRFLEVEGRLWEVASASELTPFAGKELVFAPGGRNMVSLSGDGWVRLIALKAESFPSPSRVMEQVEKRTGRRLLPNGDAVTLARAEWGAIPP